MENTLLNSNKIHYDLQHTPYYNNRLNLLKLNQSPKLSQARENLGKIVSQVIFDQCDNALKKDFGLDSKLQGPIKNDNDVLWISPSDILIGKVALKPPFTPKCLQAFTHQTILELGEQIEKKFIEQNELNKQLAIEVCQLEMIEKFQIQLKTKLKQLERDMQLKCEMELDKKQLEYEEMLDNELNDLENKIHKYYVKRIKSREYNLLEQCQEKIQEEIELVVEKITKEFVIKLEQEEIKLTNIYELELKKMEILRGFDKKVYHEKMTESLRQLKHNLECTNLVNMLFVLCNERHRCCNKLKEIEKNYNTKLTNINKQLKNKQEKLIKLNQNNKKQQHCIKIREKLLMELIKQFQKFINFALKSSPTQAEFLLSVEKMLSYEFTNELLKTTTKLVKPKLKHHYRQCSGNNVLSWKSCDKVNLENNPSSLNINDFHNCYNELDQADGDGDDGVSKDALPAIYYNNKLYLREDFRDKLAKCIEIDSTDTLWNSNLKLLIETWENLPSKSSLSYFDANDDCGGSGGDENKITNELDLSISNNNNTNSDDKMVIDEIRINEKYTEPSSVQFNTTSPDSYTLPTKKKRYKSSLKPSSFILYDLMKPINNNNNSDPVILGSKDSIELLLERKKKYKNHRDGYIDEESIELVNIPENYYENISNPSKEIVVETRDSIILRKVSLSKKSTSEFNASPRNSIETITNSLMKKNDDMIPKPSKLTLARNSIEILRESSIKLKDSKNSYLKEKDTKRSCSDSCRKKVLKKLSCEKIQLEKSNFLKFNNQLKDHTVKISKIEVIHLDSTKSRNQTCVRTDTVATTSKRLPGRLLRISKDTEKSRYIPDKQQEIKIVGEKDNMESIPFTGDRIHSLINIMKNEPSLMRLFTTGVK